MRPDTLKQIAHPVVEPVSLADAKLQLGLVPDHTEYDALIHDKISAARELLEARLGRSLALKQYRAKWKKPTSKTLTLPAPPVLVDEGHEISIEVDGAALAEAGYELEADAEPAYVELAAHPEGEVVVEFWAGPAPGSPVSKRVKSAVLMYVEHQFTNRGVLATDSSAELPQGFETLLASLSHSGGW
jgi:uncharacterized phiE125 gp8 family phage protein